MTDSGCLIWLLSVSESMGVNIMEARQMTSPRLMYPG